MKRVLAAIVVPPHLTVSGGARAAEELSRGLGGSFEVSVASMLAGGARPGEERRAVRHVPVKVGLPFGLKLETLPRRFKTLFYRSNISQIIRGGEYDLVHLHNPMPALEMLRIARTCTAMDLPYVVSTHGFNEVVNGVDVYGFGPLQSAIWRHLVLEPVRKVVMGAAEIFTLSPADDPLLKALGHTGDNVSIVSNGVAVREADGHRGDGALLASLGVAPRGPGLPPTLLFLANHTPNKGLPVLFDALKAMKQPFQMVLGGECRPDIDYAAASAACGPGQSVVTTGRLSDAGVEACFRRADVFVFPTLADTFPLVVLEAMAHGVAVVASRVGGIPYQLAEGCGVIVEPRDSAALAGALDRILADHEGRARLADAGRRRVTTQFTWERAAAVASRRYAHLTTSAPLPPRRAASRPMRETVA